MAEYVTTSARVYSYDNMTDTYTATQASNTFNTTITDGDAGDDMISTSEVISQGGFPFQDYPGYLEIDGVIMPIENFGGTFFVYSPQAAGSDTLPDSFTGADIQTGAFTVCFAPGSLIATPEGEVAVETLQIGDLIRTAEGRDVPVKWLGRQTVSTQFGPAERLMPVRFAAGSLGGGLPHCDLTVTADHAMLIDGVLCHASALVNDSTITRLPLTEMGARFTVYHVETDAHEIVLANGAPAETFIDNVSRRAFDNFAEYAALYGDTPEMEELPLPRATSARQVPGKIRAMLGQIRAA